MMRRNVIGRLSSEKGESLTELLTALLVASLGLTMFASALTASKHMMELGQKKMDAYYTGRNALEKEESDPQTAALSVQNTDGSTFNIGTSQDDAVTGSYSVSVYQGSSGSSTIWRYKRQGS